MHLADPAALFVNGTDFARHHKAGTPQPVRTGVVQAVFLPEGIEPFFRGDQLFVQFFAPCRVRKVPRADDIDTFAPCPEVQIFGDTFPAGGAGIFGMNM